MKLGSQRIAPWMTPTGQCRGIPGTAQNLAQKKNTAIKGIKRYLGTENQENCRSRQNSNSKIWPKGGQRAKKLGGGRWACILLSKMTIGGVVKKRYWDPAGIWRSGSSRKNSNHLRIATTWVNQSFNSLKEFELVCLSFLFGRLLHKGCRWRSLDSCRVQSITLMIRRTVQVCCMQWTICLS